MNAQQIRRFENLIRSTAEADPKTFDMERAMHPCGTPACVIGNYADRRDLQRTFRLPSTRSRSFCDLVVGGRGTSACGPEVEVHFGLDMWEAYGLFNPYGCGGAKTPRQAVRHLKRFLARKIREQKAARK